MTLMTLALALYLGPGTPAMAASTPQTRWAVADASLLLYDARGSVLQELGLGSSSQDLGQGLALRRTLLGGASADGRFAWHFDREERVRIGRADTTLSSVRALVYLGSSGQALWESALADASPSVQPVSQSRDGETALLVERSTAGWSVSCLSFTGSRLAHLGPYARLEKTYLTANGRYAMALVSGFEQPLTYVFFDLRKGARKELPASEVLLGVARIEEDGSVLSKTKTLFKFQ